MTNLLCWIVAICYEHNTLGLPEFSVLQPQGHYKIDVIRNFLNSAPGLYSENSDSVAVFFIFK